MSLRPRILIFVFLFSGLLKMSSRAFQRRSLPNPVFNIGKINGKYYLTDGDWFNKMTWAESLEFCHYNGYKVGVINSSIENKFLVQFITERAKGKNCFWLPATDLTDESNYFWLKTGEHFQFTNWKRGDPQINRILNCVQMKATGVWTQASCTNKYVKDPNEGCLPLCET